MKIFKKPVAILLAMVIVIGSVTIGAYAIINGTIWPIDTPVELKSETTYKRWDAETSAWVSCTNGKVQPGDTVRATVSWLTDFYMGTLKLLYVYDKTVFSLADKNLTAFSADQTLSPSIHLKYCANKDLATNNPIYEIVANSSNSDPNYSKYGYVFLNNNPDYSTDYYHMFGTVDPEDSTKRIPEPVFYIDFTVKSEAEIGDNYQGEKAFILWEDAMSSNSRQDSKYFNEVDCAFDEDLLRDHGIVAEGTPFVDVIAKGQTYYWDVTSGGSFDNVANTEIGNYVTLDGKVRFDATADRSITGPTVKTLPEYDVSGWYQKTIKASDVPVEADVATTGTNYEFLGWSSALGDETDAVIDGKTTKTFGGKYSELVYDKTGTLQTGKTAPICGDYEISGSVDSILYAVYKMAGSGYKVNAYVYPLTADGAVNTSKSAAEAEGAIATYNAKADIGADITADEAKNGFSTTDIPEYLVYEDNNLTDDKITLVAEVDKDNPSQNIINLYYVPKDVKMSWAVKKGSDPEKEIKSVNVKYGANFAAINLAGKTPTTISNAAYGDDFYGYDLGTWSTIPDTGSVTTDITFYNTLTPKDVTVNLSAAAKGTDASTGTWSAASYTIPYDSTFTAPADNSCTYTPEAGYHTEDGYVYADGSDVTFGSALNGANYPDLQTALSITLYPKTAKNEGKVNYDSNAVSVGATEANVFKGTDNKGAFCADPESGNYKFGDTVDNTFTAEATLNGYNIVFQNWNTKADGTGDAFNATFGGANITYYAQYKKTPKNYTITYVDNGGTNPNTVTTYNIETETITLLDAAKADYTFDGWYNAGNDKVTEIAKGTTGDIELTAKFTPIDYNITYDLNGGKLPDGAKNPQDYNVETETFILPVAKKDGYTFEGWTGSNGTAPQTTVQIAKGSTGDKAYTANWKPIDYTIKFVVDGTELAGEDITPVNVGQTFAFPTVASVPNKTFKGWYLDSELNQKYEGDFKMIALPEGTYTLYFYAKNIENEPVVVTYKYLDNTTAEIKGYPGDAIADTDIPELKDVDGYTVRWNENLTVIPDADTTVKEERLAKDTKVSFVMNDGTPAAEPQNLLYNAKVKEPTEPSKAKYTFDAWTLAGKKYDFDKTLEENVKAIGAKFDAEGYELVATYTENAITDTYYAVTGVDATGSFKYSEQAKFVSTADKAPYTVPTPADMTGYTFKGWKLDKNIVEPDGNYAEENRDFYADYEINTYKVNYVVDGETVDTKEVKFASSIPAIADPTKEGYVFAGWTSEDAKIGDQMPAKDVTFTATFTEKVNEYTVTYIADDLFGNEYTYAAYTAKVGGPVPQPSDVPTKLGYIFDGWDSEVPAEMPEEDIVFYATWRIDPMFVAIVVGGTVIAGGTVASVAAANAALITGAAVVGGIAAIGGAVILANKTYKVTYLVDGEEYRTYYILAGTKVIVPADPSKDGYEFAGWDADIPEKMPENDLVFNAKFTAVGADSDSQGAAEDVSTIPETGSASAGIAAFAVISSAAAAAYVLTKKKRED